MVISSPNAYKELPDCIREFIPPTLLSSAWTLTTNLGLSLSIGPPHVLGSMDDH